MSPQLQDRYRNTIYELVRRTLALEKWKRDVTGNSPLFDIANENTPATLSSDQDDYDPGFYDVLRINATADISITGIARGQKGRFLELCNISSYNFTLPYESASSSAANRIINSSGEDIRVFPTGRVRLYYDATLARWIIPDPPSWRGAYGMSVRLFITTALPGPASKQTIPDGIPTQLLLDTLDPNAGDPYGFFDSANNRIQIPAGLGGLYVGRISGTWGVVATGGKETKLFYVPSGSGFPGYPGYSPPGMATGYGGEMSCPIAIICAPGDTISFYASQDTGVDQDLYYIDLHIGRLF